MDVGELNMRNALACQLMEEIGFDLNDQYKIEMFSLGMLNPRADFVVCGHLYKIEVGQEFKPVLSEEHNEFKWFLPQELAKDLDISD